MTTYPGVRILPSGTVAYTLREPDHAGVIRQRNISRDRDTDEPFASPYQAHRARLRHQAAIDGGHKAASRQTLGPYLTAWLASRPALPPGGRRVSRATSDGAISPSTRRNYRLMLRYITAHLGETPLADLTATQVRTWHRAMLLSYAPKTVNMAHHVLSAALDSAVEDRPRFTVARTLAAVVSFRVRMRVSSRDGLSGRAYVALWFAGIVVRILHAVRRDDAPPRIHSSARGVIMPADLQDSNLT